MNIISSLFSENLINSLGWTLIHSFWQITLVALLLKVFLLFLSEKFAKIRYGISIVSLTIIIICSSVTFSKYYFSESGNYGTVNNILEENINSKQALKQSDTFLINQSNKEPLFLSYDFVSKMNDNLNIIIGLWLLGMFFFSVRFAGGYWYVQRLKTRNNSPLSHKLEFIVTGISKKLDIKRRIKIVESAVAEIPIAIGYLKPIIILPVGLVTSLPYDQVEAVLTHEIAHIKRNDFLINILKSVLEILYFYHPAFWWITSVLESERENCCDDMTIKSCGNALSLQNALINLYENNQKPTYIAAALFKNKYQLLKRIKRMKTKKQTNHGFKVSLAGFIILITGIVIFTVTSAFSPGQNDIPENDQFLTFIHKGETKISIEHVEEKNSEAFLEIVPEKVNSKSLVVEQKPDSTREKTLAEGTIHLEIDEKGNLLKATKNGKELNSEEKEKYEQLINRNRALEEKEDDLKQVQVELEKRKEQLNAAQEKMDEAAEEYNKAMEYYYQTLASTTDNKDLEVWSHRIDNYSNAFILSEMADSNYFDLIWDFSEDWEELEENELLEKFEDFKMDEQFDISFELYEDALKLQELEMDLIMDEIDLQIEDLHDLKLLEMEMGVFESRIRSELVRDNLLNNEDDELSFKISRKKLEVNGKKQSKALHKKYLNLCEDMFDEEFDNDKTIMIID